MHNAAGALPLLWRLSCQKTPENDLTGFNSSTEEYRVLSRNAEGEHCALVVFKSDRGKCVLGRKKNLLHGECDIGSN